MQENQQTVPYSDIPGVIEFQAVLVNGKIGIGDKRPRFEAEILGTNGNHLVSELGDVPGGIGRIIFIPSQQKLPATDKPSVAEGQVSIDMSGVVQDVEFFADPPVTDDVCPYLDDNGMNCSFEDGMDIPPTGTTRCPECPAFGDPQGSETPAPDEEGQVPQDGESASESEPGAADGAEASDDDQVPFDEGEEKAEPVLEPEEAEATEGPLDNATIGKLLKALEGSNNEEHVHHKHDGLHYTMRRLDNTAKCLVRITIGDAADDDTAIAAVLNLIKPLGAPHLTIEGDHRNFKVPLAMWLSKRDEGEPTL